MLEHLEHAGGDWYVTTTTCPADVLKSLSPLAEVPGVSVLLDESITPRIVGYRLHRTHLPLVRTLDRVPLPRLGPLGISAVFSEDL